MRIILLLLLATNVSWASSASDQVQGGDHWRLQTRRGVVHVWRPAGYLHETAGVVLYVHGYGNSADRSWRTFFLCEQFRASRRNALFIVPDGPKRRGHRVRWPDLDQLLAAVAAQTGSPTPSGPITALGHSAGFRTLSSWIGHPRLSDMALLDALYARQREFASWLDDPRKKMVLIAAHTRPQAERWVRRITRRVKGTRRRRRIPPSIAQLVPAERAARLLYFRSQYEHSQIVRIRTVLPMILRLGRLPKLIAEPPTMLASALVI